MSLKQWQEYGWLTAHTTSPDEIANLLAIVDRDLKDSARELSPDWRFGIAYNAALKTILLYAQGYRAARQLQHYRTIQALPLILGEDRSGDATYLDVCRKKRNTVEYDSVGGVTFAEAEELTLFVRQFRAEVLKWLKKGHPQLLATRGRGVVS